MITKISKTVYKYLFCLFFLFMGSCNQKSKHTDKKVERAFYYWKSVFKLTDYEKACVDSLHVSTLYLKFFDVDWNEVTNQPNPVAQIRIVDGNYLQQKNVVPVIFITNECILKIDSLQATPLAEKIYKLVSGIANVYKLTKINEIQIDCDWTESTKGKYFAILKRIKQLAKYWTLSATIRLHQVKFMTRSGIPPVDKGLLMCYNMGNLKNPATNNSIIELTELKKYIGNLDKYPLRLDMALPLFEWKVLFRNGSYKGLIEDLPDSIFKHSFVEKKENRYSFLKDTVLMGYVFKKNDMLRYENSDYNSVIVSAKEINDRLAQNDLRVSLYHLDSITLSKYTVHEMENIYNGIH